MPGRDYVVGTGDGAHFATLTEATESVAAGDVITLQPGLYEELVKVTEDVTIVAAAQSSEEDDTETTVAGGIVCTANMTLRGVQVRGQVDVRKGHAIIEECDIHHGHDGVRVGEKGKLTLRACRVHHCSAGGTGVYFMPESGGEVVDCDIYECRVNGIQANHASVVVRDCRIRDCPFGVYWSRQASGLIASNTIEHIGKFGIYVMEESDPVVRSNAVRECSMHCAYVSRGGKGMWTDNSFDGSVHVLAGCSSTFGENRVSGLITLEVASPPDSAGVPVAAN